MYYSIRGKITEKGNRFLVVENGEIGYQVFVSNPKEFSEGDDVFLYLHQHIREDNNYLVGFKSKSEKEGFNLLLNVNGIGPKSAIAILSKISYEELLEAISLKDYDKIRKIPGISEKTASQIILDLRDHITRNARESKKEYGEIREALKTLKFKCKDIDRVLKDIYIVNATREEIIKEALRRLQNAESAR